MSDTAVKRTGLFSQERQLQNFLLSSTIPLMEGGGLVFPLGILSKGYRLDESQFLCYRAALAESFLSDRTKTHMRIVVATGAFLILVLISLLAMAVFLLANPEAAVEMFDIVFDNVAMIVISAIAVPGAAMLVALFYPFWQRRQQLRRDFPEAPQVSRFAHLRRRQLGMAAAVGFNPVVFMLIAAAWVALGLAWLILGLLFDDFDLMRVLMGVFYISLGLYFGGLSWVPWSFRRRLGRKPTAEDLEPV